MNGISPAALDTRLRTYFDITKVPGNLRFYTVPVGDNRGRIWTDNPDKPTCGLRTYWNCAAHNTASAALAHKLGYGPMHKYRLV